MINRLLKRGAIALAFFVYTSHCFSQTETFSTGSFIINMGATNPNTINNGLKPYGLIYDLIRNYQCPIKWIISQTKLKDGVDFTYNGVGYKGGTFIIPKEFRTAAVNARITFWQGKGVVGLSTVSPLTLDVYRTLLSVPRWTLDKQNGKIAEQFLINAGITNIIYPGAYNWRDPAGLGPCDDLFIMPHADPTWATHGNLYNWNRTYLGSVWADCHAVSVLENMFNPANPAQHTNFLSTNGLIPFRLHDKGSPPYINRLPSDPVSQYLGLIDLATTNGSEEIYIPDPSKSSIWRPTTKILAYDPTQRNVANVAPDLSNSAGALLFGRGFGNSNYGWVTYLAGHNANNGSGGSIAAQRSFFNFSFFQVIEKAPVLPLILSITANQILNSEATINLAIGNATSPVPGVTFSYKWLSSCGGTFIPASGIGQNVSWVAPTVASVTNCVLSCIVTDNCGRSSIQSIPVKISIPVRITSPTQAPTTLPDSIVIIPSCGGSQSITYNVLNNDSDPNGKPLSLTAISAAAGGTISFTSSGNITYTPNPGFYGVENITYHVCNTEPFCDSNIFKITVGDPTLLPSVTNDSYTIIEDHIGKFNVLANDGSGLTVMGIPVQPAHGKVSINTDNTIDYLPNVDYSGTDNFTYKVTNTSGYTKQATVSITITTDGCSGGTYETVAAYSGTTTFNPVADTYLHKANTTKNYGSCIDDDIDGETAQPIRSLLRFDLASTSPLTGIQIPAAATTILSASLSMVATTVKSSTAFLVNIHKVTTAWGEGNLCNATNTAVSNGATWNNKNFATVWTTAGGDYNATVEGSTNVSVTGSYNWSITNLVQSWLTTPANNFGLLAKFNSETTANEQKTFSSRENVTASNRPVLSATWYVPHVCTAIPTRAPMAMPDTATTPNGIAVNIATAANDYFPNAGTKNYTILTTPAYGTAGINLTSGIITYTPNTTFNGVDSLRYEVLNTTTGLKDTAYVFIKITNGHVKANNDTPVADSSDATQTINVKANDSDPEIASIDNTYTVNITKDPKNGSAVVDGSGNIIYTPYTGFTGNDTLYYSITEPAPSCGNPFSDTARVVIVMLNKKPTAVDDIKNLNPCETVTFSLINNDTDPENGVLSVTNISALNPGGSGTVINNNDGTITFTPATGFTGIVTFTYTVTDNGIPAATSDPATVTLNITPAVNNPPVALNDYADTTNMDQVSIINVLDNDSDPDNNGLENPTIITSTVHGTATVLPNGLINYVPNPGYLGTDSLTYQVCDIVYNPGNCVRIPSLCATAKAYFTIVMANMTIAVNDENGTWANTSVSGSVMFNDFDPDGDSQFFNGFKDTLGSCITNGNITLRGVDMNNNPVTNAGTLTISPNGSYLFMPAFNFVGIATVKYQVTDNAPNAALDSAELKITVNYFPKISNSIIANNDEYITYGNALTGNVLTNDRDPQGDLFTVTSFKYDSDGDGIKEATGIPGVSYLVAGYTTSGLAVNNAGSLIFNSNGSFTFTPVADFHGAVEILYTTCDNVSTPACAATTLKIIILPNINGNQNDPPVAGDDFNVTTINTPVNGNFIANDYDPNGDPLTMNGSAINTSGAHTPIGAAVTTAAGGSVQYYTDGTYTYTPFPGYAGPDSTGYQVCDVTIVPPQPLCTSGFLHFLVSAFNSILPIDDVNNTWVNMPVSGNVLTNDQDPEDNTLTLTGIRDASNVLQTINGGGTTVAVKGKDKNGNVVANTGSLQIFPNGSYTFTPASNFTGNAVTKYSICDNGIPQVCKEVTVTITVNNVPQTNGSTGTPGANITIANNDAKATIVNVAVTGNVLSNDYDPEGNTKNFQAFLNQDGSGSSISTGAIISGLDTAGAMVANAGTITFNNSGGYTYTPTPGFIGSISIPYKICDNGNPVACDQATLTVTVVPNINHSANKRPVGTDDFSVVNNLLNPGAIASGNVLTNDIDPGSGNSVNGTSLSVQNTGSFATTHGNIAIAANGSYNYIPNSTYTGPDKFIYTLCDNGSPGLCTKATIYFLDIQAPTVLPIHVVSFSGQLLTTSNLLNWAAVTGTNSSYFEIESSSDLSVFSKIGRVDVKGNLNVQMDYIFVHQNPAAGINYYRLKIIDKDGKYFYSNIVSLRRNGIYPTINHAYPNPFKDKVQVAINADKAEWVDINIYNGSGSKIRMERAPVIKGLNIVDITGLEKLASGIYLVEIKDSSVLLKAKIIKAN